MVLKKVILLCSPCLCTPPIPPVTNTGMPTYEKFIDLSNSKIYGRNTRIWEENNAKKRV